MSASAQTVCQGRNVHVWKLAKVKADDGREIPKQTDYKGFGFRYGSPNAVACVGGDFSKLAAAA